MKRIICTAAILAMICASLTSCGGKKGTSESSSAETTEVSTLSVSTEATTEAQKKEIDYMALVNKLHALPDGWEDSIETVKFTNSVGDEVEVERKAMVEYLRLKEELEAEGIYVDLDSARRSLEEQQRIMDDFIRDYGADYAAKTVAPVGYSEHHTGLALDLYLIIDGEDIVLNEEMMKHPDIWEKRHEQLAAHGFILRYLDGKEHITGYAYEPWHIRYIADTDAADEIMTKGITLEEYLDDSIRDKAEVEFGSSELFSEDELNDIAIQVKCKFASFEGCTLTTLRYAGDASSTDEALAKMREKDGKEYTQVAEFLSNFYTSDDCTDFEPDSTIEDYQWWRALDEEDGWQLVTYGE